ncbi:MAG: hypothetical protein ACRDN0_24275, partial [Trebonia sp.]
PEVTASRRMYVDVAAARIQQYIGRTPRLKGQRGASAWLSWATSDDQVVQILGSDQALRAAGAEANPEAGQADGLISVRLPADADPQPVAAALAARLREVLPAVEIAGLWGSGPSYLEAYRDRMKPQRDNPPLVSLPPSGGMAARRASCRYTGKRPDWPGNSAGSRLRALRWTSTPWPRSAARAPGVTTWQPCTPTATRSARFSTGSRATATRG